MSIYHSAKIGLAMEIKRNRSKTVYIFHMQVILDYQLPKIDLRMLNYCNKMHLNDNYNLKYQHF